MLDSELVGDVIKIVLMFVLIVTLLVGCAVFTFDRPTCLAKTADIGYPHRWSFFGGCQIEIEGNWIPLENYYYKDNK